MTLDPETFAKQIKRLELAFNWHLPQGADTLWFKELSKQNYTDQDLIEGVTGCLFYCKRFPVLAEVNEQCQKKRAARLQSIHRMIKKQEVKDHIPTGGTPLAKECKNMIKKLYAKKITPEQYNEWIENKGWTREKNPGLD